jgi:RNA polymerase sigma-70 factor (ECF subfamily)
MRAEGLETTPVAAIAVPPASMPRVADSAGELASRFAVIVEEHKDLLVNYLTRLTGDRDRAEDLAQETFVRFYEHRDQYRDQGSPRAYLLTMATNLLRDEQRRRGRWLGLLPVFSLGGKSPDGIHTEELPRERDPQRVLLSAEAVEAVQAALGELDLLHRAPLILREIEGLAYQEIAEILQCQEGTVKSRLHRARHALKEKLAEFWASGQAAAQPGAQP